MEATDEMTISLRTFLDEGTDQFGVEVMVYGLASQEMADKAKEYVRKQLCGVEMSVN